MKKILLFLILTIGCLASYAQDVIVKNDGSTVLCKIIGVNNTEVIYTKWSDADGPQYIIDLTNGKRILRITVFGFPARYRARPDKTYDSNTHHQLDVNINR